MIRQIRVALLLSFTLSLLSCSAGKDRIIKDEMAGADRKKAAELRLCISEINKNAPETVSASFLLSGENRGKKFKFEGSLRYHKKGYAKVRLLDYIFRSPVITAHRNMDRLYFYYPSEKRLYTDDFNKIDFQRYTGFPSDFRFIYYLFSGRIPELKGGRVVKCLQQSSSENYLIFENDSFYESIFFENNVPRKILMIHKLTRKKVEIYIKSVARKGKSIFFKRIRIIAPDINVSMQVDFRGVRINSPLKVIPFRPEKLGRKIKVIKVN